MNQYDMKLLLDPLFEEHRQLKSQMNELGSHVREMMDKLNTIERIQEKTRDKLDTIVFDYLMKTNGRTEVILSALSQQNDVPQVRDLEKKCLTLLDEKLELIHQNQQLEKDIEQLREKLRDAGMSKPRQSDQPTEDDSSVKRGQIASDGK